VTEIDFQKIAPYLHDPLVLVGFVMFTGLLFAKVIVRPAFIPQMTQGGGFKILRLILTYGFVIAILVILLGFGLKYRDLSRAEQERTVKLLIQEIRSDENVVSEITKSAETLKNASDAVSVVLRTPRIRILAGLFPAVNLDPAAPDSEKTNLFNERFDWLQSSGLLTDRTEVTRFNLASAAVKRTIERTRSTILSLADRTGQRYQIHDAVFNSQLPVLRKITVVDVTGLSALYERLRDARETYFRVADSVVEYLDAVSSFCTDRPVTRDTLSLALAKERLVYALLAAQVTKMAQIEPEVQAELVRLAGEPGSTALK